MKKRLYKLIPPGFPVKVEFGICAGAAAAAFLLSLEFLISYFEARANMYIDFGDAVRLAPNAMMPDFAELLGGSMNGFIIVAAGSLLFIIYHYMYYYQGAKMIYLMKRLPKRHEYLRRCIFLPVILMLAILAALVIILLLYYGIYNWLTPEITMAPDQWRKLFS